MVATLGPRAGAAVSRSVWLSMAVVAALTGAGLADRLAPSTLPLPAPDAVTHPGGVWACPFLKAANSAGQLHVANVGRDRAHVRISYVVDGRRPVTQTIDVGPQRAGTVTPPRGLTQAAGAILEYAGGELVVSRTAFFAANGGIGGAGAPCTKPDAQSIVAAQGRTLGVDTQLVVMNPGTADAVVDVALLFDGQHLQPESLRGRVVPARGRLIVREGDFAFDEAAVSALVQTRTGRVVADAVLTAPRLIEIVPATPASRELVAIGSTSTGALSFTSVGVGDADAVNEGRTLSGSGQGAYERLAAGLIPNAPLVAAPTVDLPAGGVALAVSSSTAPLALGARWTVQGGRGTTESAATIGVPPSRRMTAVIGPPGVAIRLLVANPDPHDSTLSVTILTEAGASQPSSLQGIRLPAGHAVRLGLGTIPATAAVAVIVSVEGARAVAALEAITSRPVFSAYAVTALPAAVTGVVAVEPDPRAGVPA